MYHIVKYAYDLCKINCLREYYKDRSHKYVHKSWHTQVNTIFINLCIAFHNYEEKT